MKMILIRHGESVDDILDCYGGAADYSLSEAGKQTAKDAANALSGMPIDKIYSSPLKRAVQTAEEINQTKGCGINIVAGLKERNSYGVLSGCNKDMCKDIYGYILVGLKSKPGDYYSDELVMGAEAKEEFDERVRGALLAVATDAQENGYQTVAVVTHGNVTRSIYQKILCFDKKIELELLARTIIDYENGDFLLIKKDGVYEK